MQHVAFLRAINVGGRAVVKMADVAAAFAAAGCRDVRTVIASGNILFDAPQGPPAALRARVGRQLATLFGQPPVVIYRSLDVLVRLRETQPFGRLPSDTAVKLYVLFVERKTNRRPAFPMTLPKERLEAIGMDPNGDVLVVSRRKASGWYGFPTLWIEKELEVVSTARSWSTVEKIAASRK
jgi:uncharacterized protein (DUF1697 family)